VLLANQMDKFHNWAKRNAAAIDALDITPPASSGGTNTYD
jgi:hypothetical protein